MAALAAKSWEARWAEALGDLLSLLVSGEVIIATRRTTCGLGPRGGSPLSSSPPLSLWSSSDSESDEEEAEEEEDEDEDEQEDEEDDELGAALLAAAERT